jgi:hypothetical protein
VDLRDVWVFVIDNTRKAREYWKVPYTLISILRQIFESVYFEINIVF